MRRKQLAALLIGSLIAWGATLSTFASAHAAEPKKQHSSKSAQKASKALPKKPRRTAANDATLAATRRLALRSSAALVIEQNSGKPLFEKNADQVVPIASITKLMTAMVVLDAKLNLDEDIRIGEDDVDTLRGSRSRLRVGAELSRSEALLLALMSSENRAAHALARHYPGGISAFIAAMNRKAVALGMMETRFEDPTGLSSNNVSSAHDLARMVAAAHGYPLIRDFSTNSGTQVKISGRTLAYNNTNRLVKQPEWDIGVSKTGFIHEAGKCLVMQARLAEKPVVIVLLDSAGSQTRIGDATRIKRWLESASASAGSPRATGGHGA